MISLEDTIQRNKEIYRLRLTGLTLQAIGYQYGITKESVRRIVLKERIKVNREHRLYCEANYYHSEISDRDKAFLYRILDDIRALV